MNGMPFQTYYGVYTPNGQEGMMMNHTTYPVAFPHPQIGQQVRPLQMEHYHPSWQTFQPMMTGGYMPAQSYGQQGMMSGIQVMHNPISSSVNYGQSTMQETTTFTPASSGLMHTSPMIGIYPKITTSKTQESMSHDIPQANVGSSVTQLLTEEKVTTSADQSSASKPAEIIQPTIVLSKVPEQATPVVDSSQMTYRPVVSQVTQSTDMNLQQRPSSMTWMAPRVEPAPRVRTTGHPAYKDLNLTKFRADDFEFGPKIGKGKFGDVYLCKDKKTNFIVAIKVLDKMTIRQMRALRQIVREIKHHSYLKHENIIKLYGVFHDEEKIYMIMEYACDGEIYKELKSCPGRKFPEDRASNYIKQVLEAINYLHENDIIHRDIKPENLLKSFGQVKLADFGWSVYAPENKNKRKTFCGTLDYVPPEMVQGEKYDYHTDNWGIGILAFEFVTGQPPFGKKTMRDTLDCIVEGELVIPETVSKEAADFIKAMLQSNPKLRMELSEALVHPWITKHNP
jgi:aurora kinase, other